MLRRPEWLGWCALFAWLAAPAWVFAQNQGIGAVIQVALEADDDDDDDAESSREITVEIKQDGKKLTVTQTVDGDFVGEIVEEDESTAVKADTLEKLKEKFPDVHAAFTAKPANQAAKVGAPVINEKSMTEVNGLRTIQTKQPGRQETIKDKRGQDIEITIKQDLEHGTRTERYEADNAETLKKKFPQIAQLYQQHQAGAAFGGVVNVQIQGGGQFRIGGAPGAQGPRKITGEHDGQRVVIKDENGRNIRITVTKSVEGKDVTEEFQADDPPALKKQHPEIAKIYDKLAGKGMPQQQQFGVINGRQIPIGVQAPALPVQPVPDPVEKPAAADANRQLQLQLVKRALEQSQKRLEQLAADPKFAEGEAAKKLAEEIAGIAKKIEELDAKKK